MKSWLIFILAILVLIVYIFAYAFEAHENITLRAENAVLTQEVDALSERNQSLKRNAVELAKENDELREDVNYLIELLCGGEE